MPINTSICPLYGLQTLEQLVELIKIDKYQPDNQDIEGLRQKLNLYAEKSVITDDLTGKRRLCEVPPEVLKKFQERIHKILLNSFEEQFPDYLFSFQGPLQNAMAHVNEFTTLRIDVHQFFKSTKSADVRTFFRERLGLSEHLTELLTELTTYQGHLPTGAPSSPILSFLAYENMWDRIAAFCTRAGYVFTLYIDDLIISGTPVQRRCTKFVRWILQEYQFRVAKGKVKWFREGQPKRITGVIVTPDGHYQVPHKTHLRLNLRIQQAESAKTRKDRKKRLRQVRGLRRWIQQVEQANLNSGN